MQQGRKTIQFTLCICNLYKLILFIVLNMHSSIYVSVYTNQCKCVCLRGIPAQASEFTAVFPREGGKVFIVALCIVPNSPLR
jgi:hypothetical protein